MPSSQRYDINADLEAEYEEYLKEHNRSNTSTVDFSNLLFSLRRTLTRAKRGGRSRQSYKNIQLPSEKEVKKKEKKDKRKKSESSYYVFGSLSPLKSTEFVHTTRKSLMMELKSDGMGCNVWDGAELCFTCSPDISSLVCQNPVSNLDLLSIGKIDNGTLGIYYTVDGWKCSDGKIAKIHKVKSLQRKRKKYKIELVRETDRNKLFHMEGGKKSSSQPTNNKTRSLLVRSRSKNGCLFEVMVREGRFGVATIEKGELRDTYNINVEPHVDTCFMSTLALYILRKRLLKDKQLVGMKLHTSSFTGPRITRKIRYSVSRRRKSSGIIKNENK